MVGIGGPVVKALHFHCEGISSIHGQGTKILAVVQCAKKINKKFHG